jgi:hypothetical protein
MLDQQILVHADTIINLGSGLAVQDPPCGDWGSLNARPLKSFRRNGRLRMTIDNQLTFLFPGVVFASPAQGITDGVCRIDPETGLNVSRNVNFQPGPGRLG